MNWTSKQRLSQGWAIHCLMIPLSTCKMRIGNISTGRLTLKDRERRIQKKKWLIGIKVLQDSKMSQSRLCMQDRANLRHPKQQNLPVSNSKLCLKAKRKVAKKIYLIIQAQADMKRDLRLWCLLLSLEQKGEVDHLERMSTIREINMKEIFLLIKDDNYYIYSA
ncbi:hypothetical protein FGO68_gene10964 [Halteria grandinella]|uniref:Uncharacterized protein n=1 Tax=Halteria grandinella TaxID=5974 RepID=A0A8J8NU06_HALGN|nr:hypothetical protein FGO68_gene10964 [Halteria grandinella]